MTGGGAVPFTLSISLGIAVHDLERACSIDDLLKEADELMYRNKLRKKQVAGQGRTEPDRT